MNFIPQMEPWFGEEEKIAMNNYMSSDGWMTEFKKTEEFENQIAKYTGAKYCIVVNNGTISLTLAAYALGLRSGDKVIVPNYTMVATPNSIKMIGAEPVFCDVEEESLCIDINHVSNLINSDRKIKGVFFMNANGRYPKNYKIEDLITICKNNGLFLIEDSAQALGSFFSDGVHCGLKGDIGSISFSAPKIISTGQGGALITNNDDLNKTLRKIKDFGRSSGGNDIHDVIGWNFKFTEMQAVLGVEQMKKLEHRVSLRKNIYKSYIKKLQDISDITFFEHNFKFTTPWFIDCKVSRRDDLMRFLKENNIGTRIMYPPLNKQKAYSEYNYLNFPISNLIGEQGLWLPSANQLSEEQIEFVCSKIRDFYA